LTTIFTNSPVMLAGNYFVISSPKIEVFGDSLTQILHAILYYI